MTNHKTILKQFNIFKGYIARNFYLTYFKVKFVRNIDRYSSKRTKARQGIVLTPVTLYCTFLTSSLKYL